MGDGLNFIDIIFFALVAAFLVFRLRSVLGRRTGHEKRRFDPFSRRPDAAEPPSEPEDKVVQLPDRSQEPGPAEDEAEAGVTESLSPVAAGLRAIAAADPAFDRDTFLAGARTAFTWIVEAYANGETEKLRPLLSNHVYDDFAATIEARAAAGETVTTDLVGISSAEILEAEMQGRTAFITVKFVSEQVNVTRDEKARVVDGNPERIVKVTDIWTFARNTRSRDPNWTLVATRSSN